MPGQAQVGNAYGVPAVSAGTTNVPTNLNGGSVAIDTAVVMAGGQTNSGLLGQMSTIDGTFYGKWAANMSVNDQLYAYRLASFNNTVKQ